MTEVKTVRDWVLRGFSDLSEQSADGFEKDLRRALHEIHRAVESPPELNIAVGLTSHTGIGATVHRMDSMHYVVAINAGVAKELPTTVIEAFGRDGAMKKRLIAACGTMQYTVLTKWTVSQMPDADPAHLFEVQVIRDICSKAVQFLYLHEMSHIGLGHFDVTMPIRPEQASEQGKGMEFMADLHAILYLAEFMEASQQGRFPPGTPQTMLAKALEEDFLRLGYALGMLFEYFWRGGSGKIANHHPAPEQRLVSVIGGGVAVGLHGGLSLIAGSRAISQLLDGYRAYHVQLVKTVDRNWLVPEKVINEALANIKHTTQQMHPSSESPNLPKWIWNLFPLGRDRLMAEMDAQVLYVAESQKRGSVVAMTFYLFRSIRFAGQQLHLFGRKH